MFLKLLEFEFKKDFFQSIILQCNHLKKNIRFEKDPLIVAVEFGYGDDVNGISV